MLFTLELKPLKPSSPDPAKETILSVGNRTCLTVLDWDKLSPAPSGGTGWPAGRLTWRPDTQ